MVLAELADGPAACGKLREVGVYLLGTSVSQGQLTTVAEREEWTKHDAVAALVTRS